MPVYCPFQPGGAVSPITSSKISVIPVKTGILYANRLPFRAKLVTWRTVSFFLPFLKRKEKRV